MLKDQITDTVPNSLEHDLIRSLGHQVKKNLASFILCVAYR